MQVWTAHSVLHLNSKCLAETNSGNRGGVTCNFCGTSADEDTIHSGDYSGEHICEGSSCAIEYMNQNILINPFEPKEVTITVCDRCDEEIDDGDEIHHLGGDDFCGHCIDYRKVED